MPITFLGNSEEILRKVGVFAEILQKVARKSCGMFRKVSLEEIYASFCIILQNIAKTARKNETLLSYDNLRKICRKYYDF